MRFLPTLSILVFAILAFALTVAAFPSSSVAQPTGSELQQYEEYLRRGSKAFESKDYEVALLLFAKAQEIHDHPRLRFSVARIYEELEQCVAAKVMYTLLIENKGTPDELRRDAGMRLTAIDACGDGASMEVTSPATAPPDAPSGLLPVDIDEPVRSAAARRNVRNLGLWSIGIGAVLTATGAVFVSGIFVPRAHRDCFGLRGVSVDEQAAACETITGTDGSFLSAHARSRQVVQQHRIVSAAMLAAGLAGTVVGLTLLQVDRRHRTAVRALPGAVIVTAEF